jgi:2-desacetyl-2-hydroxyethyl bacteriochlorophyllide A dehydrogenase
MLRPVRQVILEQPGRFVCADAAPPARAANEALVRVHRVGVCGTDLHAFAGEQPYFTYPRILGHELGVEVVESPASGQGLKPGDRCAVEPYLSCGDCHACRLGKYNCCEHLRVLGVHTDGGMREYLAVPADRLHKSGKLSLDQLALVETLGIGAHAVMRSGLRAGEDVLVVGAGPVGLSVVQFARAAGGLVRVLETSPQRREFVARLGVETLAVPDARLADVVFDATGNARAMAESVSRVAHGGTLVFVGLVQASVELDDPLFHRREVTLYATRNSAHDFPRIIGMIAQGQIDTTPWITHRLPLAEVPALFSSVLHDQSCVKAMIEVSG